MSEEVVELPIDITALVEDIVTERVGLGVTLWTGHYEGKLDTWLLVQRQHIVK